MQVGIHNIVELNKMVKDNQLEFRIHLSDACGGSSMWIESLSEGVAHDTDERLYQLINDYFSKHNISIQYNKDCSSFWTT